MTKGTNVLFRDVTLILVASLLAIVLILLTLEDKKKEDEAIDIPQASLIFEIAWPSEIDVDIDLWVYSESTNEAIGFKNKHGQIGDLLRDDLGTSALATVQTNMEVTYIRYAIPGRYYMNVHYYDPINFGDIPIQANVRTVVDKKTLKLFEGTVILKKPGHEITVVSFNLDKDGYFFDIKYEYYSIVGGTVTQ